MKNFILIAFTLALLSTFSLNSLEFLQCKQCQEIMISYNNESSLEIINQHFSQVHWSLLEQLSTETDYFVLDNIEVLSLAEFINKLSLRPEIANTIITKKNRPVIANTKRKYASEENSDEETYSCEAHGEYDLTQEEFFKPNDIYHQSGRPKRKRKSTFSEDFWYEIPLNIIVRNLP